MANHIQTRACQCQAPSSLDWFLSADNVRTMLPPGAATALPRPVTAARATLACMRCLCGTLLPMAHTRWTPGSEFEEDGREGRGPGRGRGRSTHKKRRPGRGCCVAGGAALSSTCTTNLQPVSSMSGCPAKVDSRPALLSASCMPWHRHQLPRPPTQPTARGNAYDVLVANFDEAYNGNRAPFPVFIHTPWCAAIKPVLSPGACCRPWT